ncbi:MAG: hypothetical protein M0P26_00170 [Bacteroidales bacterium]|jgi:hypothetical protein|nr:hypothetical protein [Bacteroidales bacterium]
MIDLMQTNLFKFCQIDPVAFWKYTPGETMMMITTSIENIELKNEIRHKLEARLCAVVLSANGVMKSGKTPYSVEDFMPKKQKARPKSPEELEKMALTATMMMGGEVSSS